jgi:GTP pyrophosphokinase
MVQYTPPSPDDFFQSVQKYLSKNELKKVQAAFEVARREHGEQRRKSGELFFTHPLTVAYYLSEYNLDADTLCAALLHDIAEDTKVSLQELRDQFGAEVAMLVDGVTKLKDVSAGIAKGRQLTPAQLQDASLAKMFDFMTNDVRVVLIKLFDRLHNMRTIKAMSPASQRRKAIETLTVYTPIANRLGIWKVKNELEALSLEVIKPHSYQFIKSQRDKLLKKQHELSQTVSGQILECLLEANVNVLNIYNSPENIYTIYQDLTSNKYGSREIDSAIRMVVLLEDWVSCYQALGLIHQLWKPVPGTFDDYIANPRDNLYRSLHTTVIHTSGNLVKVRFRTKAMDIVSQIGVLAKWRYKDSQYWSKEIADRVNAFLENIQENIALEPQNPTVGVKGVVEDVFRKQIQVFTPKGEPVDLPVGATALDFAYTIHTGLGNQSSSATVNGVLYPLNKPLTHGDQVKVTKRLKQGPHRSWLDEDLGYLTTNYARTHARRWFRRLSEEDAVSQGKALLEQELRMLGMADFPHEKIVSFFGLNSTAELYYQLGRADLLPTTVATRVLEDTWNENPGRDFGNLVYAPDGESFVITNADGRKLRLCGSCNPRPEDKIIGYLRKDGGVTVHEVHCHTLKPSSMYGRRLLLGWGKNQTQHTRFMMLKIDVFDRPGLLYEITTLLHDEDVNISYINTPRSTRSNEMQVLLGLELFRPRQLVRLLHQIQALANVSSVCCLPSQNMQDAAVNPLYHPE